jgi:hypothetical protein
MLYMVSMVRPVLPYVEYELNKDYIKEFLCINRDKPRLKCDGKCHLTQELRKAQSDVTDTQESNEVPSINLKDYPVAINDTFKSEMILAEGADCCPDDSERRGVNPGYKQTLVMPPECA